MKAHFALLALGLTLPLAAPAQAQLSVGEFVRGPRHPYSYQELSTLYDVSAVPELIEMLGSPDEAPQWDRIAGLLGVVGDDRAVNALIEFIEQPVPSGRLSIEQANAFTQAILSLGLLVNRPGSERALEYLIEGLTPSTWRKRNVQGVAPWASSFDEYDRYLSLYALDALALSGNPRAGEALRSLQRSPSSGQAQFRTGLDDTLTHWLEVHQLVADHGLVGMYDHYEELHRAKQEQQAEEARQLREERARARELRQAQQP